jgi:hypothetical protein
VFPLLKKNRTKTEEQSFRTEYLDGAQGIGIEIRISEVGTGGEHYKPLSNANTGEYNQLQGEIGQNIRDL